MKKIASIVMVFLIALLTLLISALQVEAEPKLAAPSFRVYVDPPLSSYDVGTTFNVTVQIESVPELFSWELRITWDPAVLSWGGIFTKGDFLSTAGDTFFIPDLSQVSNGTVKGAETLLGSVEAENNGTLAILSLKVIAQGITTINLSEEILTHLGPAPSFDLLVYPPEEYMLEDGYVIAPEVIAIYTDKYSYSVGETMHLGLNVTNPVNRAITVCIEIWVELPNGSIYLLLHAHAVTLPAGFTYSDPDFETFVLPNISPGVYTWHAALLDPTTHITLIEDKAEWEFA